MTTTGVLLLRVCSQLVTVLALFNSLTFKTYHHAAPCSEWQTQVTWKRYVKESCEQRWKCRKERKNELQWNLSWTFVELWKKELTDSRSTARDAEEVSLPTWMKWSYPKGGRCSRQKYPGKGLHTKELWDGQRISCQKQIQIRMERNNAQAQKVDSVLVTSYTPEGGQLSTPLLISVYKEIIMPNSSHFQCVSYSEC